MNNEQLRDKFLEHAKELSRSPDPSARYRMNAYNRVAAKIETLKLSDKASIDSIKKLELSEFMNAKAISFLEDKSTRSKSPKRKSTRSKSPKRKSTRSKSPKRKSDASTNPDNKNKLIKELSEFMGIGPEKAKDLIAAGLKHINQLHMKKYKDLLPEETKIFMDLKPLQIIPREYIQILEPFLMKASDEDIRLTITGSYRREKSHSSDIDLMVVSDNPNALHILLGRLSDILNGKVYPYSKGSDKMSLIIDMSDILPSDNSKTRLKKKTATDSKKNDNDRSGKKVYKLDAFRTNTDAQIPMLLYSTGSKEFNVIMRSKAKKLGYLLNQKGLYKDGVQVPNLHTEEDYFNILQMVYKEPKERI